MSKKILKNTLLFFKMKDIIFSVIIKHFQSVGLLKMYCIYHGKKNRFTTQWYILCILYICLYKLRYLDCLRTIHSVEVKPVIFQYNLEILRFVRNILVFIGLYHIDQNKNVIPVWVLRVFSELLPRKSIRVIYDFCGEIDTFHKQNFR